MVVAGDFKNGITFDMDGNVMQVIEFQHVKHPNPGIEPTSPELQVDSLISLSLFLCGCLFGVDTAYFIGGMKTND